MKTENWQSVTVTVTELSKMLEISPRQIQMYVAQGVLPRPRVKGRYHRGGCFSAWLAHKVYFGPHTFCAKNDPATAEYALQRLGHQHERQGEFEAEIARLEAKITKLEASKAK